jgi:hypothetical protein
MAGVAPQAREAPLAVVLHSSRSLSARATALGKAYALDPLVPAVLHVQSDAANGRPPWAEALYRAPDLARRQVLKKHSLPVPHDCELRRLSCAFLNNVRRGYHHTTLELLLHSNIWTKERLADYLIPRVQKNLKSVEASKGAPHVA